MQIPQPESTFHHVMEVVITIVLPVILVGLGSLVKMAFTASNQFVSLETTVLNIRDNHLHHLDEKIDNVQADVKEVRTQLFDHISLSKG